MLGRVIENVQKHLPHTRHVARDLRDLIVRRLVLQRDALLLQTAAVHEHRIFKFSQNIGFFDTQGKPAVLHSGKLQKLLHHTGQSPGLTQDNEHSAACLLRERVVRQKRLTPAGNCRERRAQLVRDGRNKFRLRLFRLADLDGHVIDGVCQFTDFIVILFWDEHAV